jgi:hypothetical protein
VKEVFAFLYHCNPSNVVLVSCFWWDFDSRDVQVGVQACGLHRFAFLDIHEAAGEDKPVKLTSVEFAFDDQEMNTSEYFGNATSRDALDAAAANGGNETVEQVLQASDEGCKEAVIEVEERVKEAFAFLYHCNPSNFTPDQCSLSGNDVVVRYFAQVDVQPCGWHGFIDLDIRKAARKGRPYGPATLNAVALNSLD